MFVYFIANEKEEFYFSSDFSIPIHKNKHNKI